MLFIALKNLFQEKTRLFISIGGVAFSVLLILILQGLYQGFNYRIGEYIRRQEADLWVGDEKARDMFHSISFLPISAREKIEAIEGVNQVNPFLGRQVVISTSHKETSTYLVGYDTASGIGAPLKVVEGKQVPDKGEIIVDRVFANNHRVKIGDNLPIGQEYFKVVGISEGTNLVSFQYSFVTKEDAQRVLKMEGTTNYFLVRLKDNANKNELVEAIKTAVPGVKVFTKQEFVDRNTEFIQETFLPVVRVLLLIGFIVGVAVIGLTIYTSTVEKSREYGVLKAIGVRNSQLYRMVFAQSLTAGVLGFIFGSLMAFVVNQVVDRFVPAFVTYFRLIDFGWVLLASILMAILASYIPIRRIAMVNPAEVFKG